MDTLRSILRDLTLVVYASAGVFLCLVLWKASKALDTINAPKSGTLSMIDDTILQGRLTIDATNKVLIHEQNQLGTIDGYARNLDAELSGLATHTDTTLDALSGSASAATKTLNTASRSVQVISDGLTPFLSHADSTVGDLDAGIKTLQPSEVALNKSIADFDAVLKPIPAIEANVQVSTFNLGQTTTDFQTKFHGFLYPPPCKTFGCKLKRTWPYVKGATEMVEPAYWLQQAIKGATP